MIENDRILQEIVRRPHTEFHPEKIYLFGSQARNSQRLESVTNIDAWGTFR